MVPLPQLYPSVYEAPLTPGLQENKTDERNAGQLFAFVKRRALIIIGVAAAVTGIVASYTFSQKAQYETGFMMLVEPLANEDKLRNITALGEGNLLPQTGLDYGSQIVVLKSRERIESIANTLKSKYPDINYYSLVNNLTVNRFGKTKILDVRYRSSDPAKVKVVLDEVAKSYLKYSLQERQTKLRQGIQFVEKQLPSQKKRVDNLQQEIKNFRQKYDFFDPQQQSELAATRMEALVGQRETIDREMIVLQGQLANLEADTGRKAALNEATLYQSLLTQVRQLDAQIALESTRFQDENPFMQSLKDKRQQLVPLLQDEEQRILDVQRAGIVSRMRLLELQSQEVASSQQQFQQRVKQLPVLEKRYAELQRNLKFAIDGLDRFIATRETLQIEIAQTELPWQILEWAEQPILPVSPNIPRNLMMGLFAGVLLGIGAGVLLERMDNTFHTVSDITNRMKLPLLGTIPIERELEKAKQSESKKKKRSKKGAQALITKEGITFSGAGFMESELPKEDTYIESTRFWESFRVLLNNILMLSSDRRIRSIVVSSASPGDGKSTVSYYLTQTAATMGLKVLLVDTDMRNPNVHKLSNLNNLFGLSSLISGDLSMENAIREMPSMNECSVITAGTKPPDTIKLLSSEKMRKLMEQFSKDYDLVIYDAPPSLGLADATLVAPNTDGMVLVTKIEKTEKTALNQTLNNLKTARVNVLGVIANGDKTKMKGYGKYYYY
jgi:capsular exopolysaccharide synthesis family protein